MWQVQYLEHIAGFSLGMKLSQIVDDNELDEGCVDKGRRDGMPGIQLGDNGAGEVVKHGDDNEEDPGAIGIQPEGQERRADQDDLRDEDPGPVVGEVAVEAEVAT